MSELQGVIKMSHKGFKEFFDKILIFILVKENCFIQVSHLL